MTQLTLPKASPWTFGRPLILPGTNHGSLAKPGRIKGNDSEGMSDFVFDHEGFVISSNVSVYMLIYTYTYIYMYMVIDLKVLVRSFNCESRACYVGNPRESFFSNSRK